MAYDTILYEEAGPVGTLTLNRPDDGNMFNHVMCHEIRDCINDIRRETRTRVLVITGAGDRFFCIGGSKDGMEDTNLYPGVLPTLEMYESINRLQKPVIASVNGFAVGGGNVLQMVCDVTIAAEVKSQLFAGDLPKGDALGVARVAAIMAAKKTASLVPLCHPIPIDAIDVAITETSGGALIEVTARTSARTGIEMEAMTAAAIGAVTLYDMIKGLDRGAEIGPIRLLHKSGGKTGEWNR